MSVNPSGRPPVSTFMANHVINDDQSIIDKADGEDEDECEDKDEVFDLFFFSSHNFNNFLYITPFFLIVFPVSGLN